MTDLGFNLQDHSTESQVRIISIKLQIDKLIYSIDANLKYDLDVLVGKIFGGTTHILTHLYMWVVDMFP